MLTGKAMDFVARVHGFKGKLRREAIELFAVEANLGNRELNMLVLPKLKEADILDYAESDGEVQSVTDFLGITGTYIEQTFRLLQAFRPSQDELALLHSVEIASFAPLNKAHHLEQLFHRGFTEAQAEAAITLALALGANKRIKSSALNEDVIFNPYVWETGQVEIAQFLRSLGPNERDVMLDLCEQASQSPGIAMGNVSSTNPRIVTAARKVGLIQATTVRSTGGGDPQTYVFSPTLELDDDKLLTTEALSHRKLFVAHILYGNEKALAGGGRIFDPSLLVQRLIERGRVGPASNIGTDYHLLEAHGIVRVRKSDGGRAYLELVKEEIAQGGLAWLQKTQSGEAPSVPTISLGRAPGVFTTPEHDRATLRDDAAANEVVESAVLRLREEVQSVARRDSPFN